MPSTLEDGFVVEEAPIPGNALSFIYKNILDICVIYNYARPNKTQYSEAVSKTTNVNYKKIYSKLTEPSNILFRGNRPIEE